MKLLKLTLITLALLYSGYTLASITCGISPIPPVGCYAVCTSTGWVYVCN